MVAAIVIVMFAAGCASGGGTSGDTTASGAIDAGAAKGSSAPGSSSSRTKAPTSTDSPTSPDTPTSDSPSGSTPAPGTQPVVQLDHFQSPSGNIACMILDDGSTSPSVRCDVLEHTFTPPEEPAGGCGSTGFGNSITLAAGAPARFMCAGDTVADPSLPVLAYGTTSAVGSFSCDSNEDGMVCADLSSGHWFRIAKASYSLN